MGAWLWRAELRAPEPTLLLLDRHGEFLAESSGGEAYGYWPLAEIPPRVAAATLAIEDHRFWSHPGVDPLSAGRALLQLIHSGRRVSGASTIAMQVARMQAPGARTFGKKLLESLDALAFTLRHGREAILRHYLRIVPYGNQIHGIAYAARRYLGKPVEDLSWAETAFLTAIPQSPARMNPFRPEGRLRAIARGRRILAELRRQAALSEDQYRLALEQIDAISIPPRQPRAPEAMHAVLHLDSQLSALRPVLATPLLRTTLDLDLQREVSWLTFEAVQHWEGYGVGNAAVIVLGRPDNQVLAWVGSSDYFDRGRMGAIDYTGVLRSPGSTLKPFLYAQALEQGRIGPTSILDDLARTRTGISNADDQFLGPVLPSVALANSRNVPAVGLLQQLGLPGFYGFLGGLGIHDGRASLRGLGLEISIGGLPTTLERLARAYGVFWNDGRLSELSWLLPAPAPPSSRQILSEATARQITLFLADPMARLPSFPRKGWTEYPFPVAVKTGTSSGYRDAWTVAYSSRYLVAVWMGHPAARPMNGVSGYRGAARLAQQILLSLHPDEEGGLRNLTFPPPAGSHPVRICSRTGRLATPACDQVLTEWLLPAQEPVDACTAHVRRAVDSGTGQLATPLTPPDRVEVRTFTDLGPRYAAWAAENGLRSAELLESRPVDSANLHITSPEPGVHVFRDPETPPELSTLPLRVTVEPALGEVVWYVDGEPYQVVASPYEARWRLQRGVHRFQARVPFKSWASEVVEVAVE